MYWYTKCSLFSILVPRSGSPRSVYSLPWAVQSWLVVRHPRYPWAVCRAEGRCGAGVLDVPLGHCSLHKCSCLGVGRLGLRRIEWLLPEPTLQSILHCSTYNPSYTLPTADKVVSPLPHPTFSVGLSNTLYNTMRIMTCKVGPNMVNIGSKWNAAVKWRRRCKIAASDCSPVVRNLLFKWWRKHNNILRYVKTQTHKHKHILQYVKAETSTEVTVDGDLLRVIHC